MPGLFGNRHTSREQRGDRGGVACHQRTNPTDTNLAVASEWPVVEGPSAEEVKAESAWRSTAE